MTSPLLGARAGLPIGNGRMGTLVWTTPSALRMQINRVDVYANNSATNSKSGIDALSNLIEGYFQNGGMHLHLNVVNRKTFLSAQQHPEEYRALSVRVTGYSGGLRSKLLSEANILCSVE